MCKMIFIPKHFFTHKLEMFDALIGRINNTDNFTMNYVADNLCEDKILVFHLIKIENPRYQKRLEASLSFP